MINYSIYFYQINLTFNKLLSISITVFLMINTYIQTYYTKINTKITYRIDHYK